MDDFEKELALLSDEEKMQLLSQEKRKPYIKKIVLSIQSDSIKLEAMKTYLSWFDYIDVFESFSSVEIKIKNLGLLIHLYNAKERIFKTLKTEDEKKRAIDLLQDESDKADVICILQDENEKIELLGILTSEDARVKVIKTFKDDDKKIEQLENIERDLSKASIIATFQDDNKKIEQLENIKDGSSKAFIIQSFEEDDKKIEYLEILTDIDDKVLVIRKIKDDDKKIKTLKLVQDDKKKADIINTLLDEEKKIELLKSLEDDYAKATIIVNLDDNKKIELLGELSSEWAKAIVITTLDDDEKIEQLQYLSDDFAKLKVINLLEDETQKIEQLRTLSDDFIKKLAAELMGIDDSEFPTVGLLTDRDKLLKFFLDEKRTYTQFGLDPRMTIGLEIEAEGCIGELLEDVSDLAARQVNGQVLGWTGKPDGSLEDGVEFESPILTDNKEDVENIYAVCTFLEKCGMGISDRCGGHIHIGADYLKSKEAYVNLFEIWGSTEKIIYKMSNEKGQVPRMGVKKFAAPISSKFNEAIENDTINIESEEDLDHFISQVKEVQKKDRYSGLNLLNINNGKNTIEFRIPNGTINPDTWIENVRLFGRLVQVSQELAEIQSKPELTKEEQRILRLKELLKEDIPEEEKMEVLLELLFSEEERAVYRERYVVTSELLEQLPSEENPFNATKFGTVVDFKKKKHTLSEFRDITVQERVATIDGVTNETVRGGRAVTNTQTFETAKSDENLNKRCEEI